MKRSDRHNFINFPYSYEIRDSGEVNNGGIDLTSEPDRIDEIHEVSSYPWLKEFLRLVNSKSGMFMTFGCAAGVINNSFCGYIDFSLRPASPTLLKERLINLDELFYEYLSQAMPEGEIRLQGIRYARNVLRWTLSPLQIRGESYAKVNLTFDTDGPEGAAWIFDHLGFFLTKEYPSLPHEK